MDERFRFWWLANLPEQKRREVTRLWGHCELEERVSVKRPFLVSMAVAARLLDVTRSLPYWLVRRGRLQAVKYRGRSMIPIESVRAYAGGPDCHRVRSRMPQKPWTKKEEALLGKKTDRLVGEKLGRSWFHVRLRRLQLGIAPSQKNNRVRL